MKDFPKGGLIGKTLEGARMISAMHIPFRAAYGAYFLILSLFPALLHGLISGSGILCSGILILFFYNHKRSEHLREFSRWFFYLFYPLHLLVLCGIRYAMK